MSSPSLCVAVVGIGSSVDNSMVMTGVGGCVCGGEICIVGGIAVVSLSSCCTSASGAIMLARVSIGTGITSKSSITRLESILIAMVVKRGLSAIPGGNLNGPLKDS